MPPGRQRTTDIISIAAPSRPREEGLSLAQQEVPPLKPSGEGSGGSHGAVSVWLPPGALWFFPARGKEQPPTSADVQGTKPSTSRERTPLARATGQGIPPSASGEAIPPPATGKSPSRWLRRAPSGATAARHRNPPPPRRRQGPSLRNPLRRRLMIYYLSLSLPCKAKPGNYRRALPVTRH